MKFFLQNIFKIFFSLNSILVFLALLSSCAVPKKEETQKRLSYSVNYLKPATVGGLWTRVIQVQGPSISAKSIDRQTNDNPNWVEIGLSDSQGFFYDLNVNQKVRYRIAGVVETPWFDEVGDLILSDFLVPRATLHGRRCIVKDGFHIYIGTSHVYLECDEILVLGSIYTFNNPGPEGNRIKASNAGSLYFKARNIEVYGKIIIHGQNGGRGGSGGDAGHIQLEASERLFIRGEVTASGGLAGPEGILGIKGTAGQQGTVVKNAPQMDIL
jgi:hypothetical protein